MIDRPTLDELLDAVRAHLELKLAPRLIQERKLYEQTAAAIETLRMADRELELGPEYLQTEWARLNFLFETDAPLPADLNAARGALAERNRRLCEQIAAGAFDRGARRAMLIEHLLMNAREQLAINNPRFLQSLAREDEERERTR